MARTVVPTSKAGDVLTAAWQNTYIKNNEAWHYQMLTPRNLWIGGWRPRETAGAGGPAVLTAGSNYFDYLAFDKDTKEYAWANIPMPLNYDGGTITAKVYWSHPATTTNFAVAWKIAAVSLTNAEALNRALGTAVQVNDSGGTEGVLYISDATGPITIAGTPAAGELVHFDIHRVADDATNDTLAVDAYLHGVLISYGLA